MAVLDGLLSRDAATAACGIRLTRHTCSCSVVSEQSEVLLAAWSQAVWFLVSDSLTARQAAKARYGDKVVTDTQAAAVHVGCEAEAGCSGNATHKAHGMQVWTEHMHARLSSQCSLHFCPSS